MRRVAATAFWFVLAASGRQVGGICDEVLFRPVALLEPASYLAAVRNVAQRAPSTCKLIRVTALENLDVWASYIAPPSVLEAGMELFWKDFVADRQQTPPPMCQVLRAGSAELARWIDGSGTAGSEAQGSLSTQLFRRTVPLNLIHLGWTGNPPGSSIELFVTSRVPVTRASARLASRELVARLGLQGLRAFVSIANRPFFFEDTFPNRNPWFAPRNLTWEEASQNTTVHCVVASGKINCVGRQ